MDDYKKLCAELVNELHGYKVAHPNHDTDLIDHARAALDKPEPESEEPVVGELVVVAHWGDFDYPMDAVQLGRLRETQEQDGKTYYYVDDLRRGFRHCRTLTPRVLPVKEAANASITTPQPMTNFRELCNDLLDELQYQTDWSIAEELKERAYAALTKPEPEVPMDEETKI